MAVAPTISFNDVLHGIIVETKAESITGSVLYSDWADRGNLCACHRKIPRNANKNSVLNIAAQIPVIGIVAGATRVALGAIHTIGHLFAALITQNKGHLWHAAKGGWEMLRGIIEAIPVVGRIFANIYIRTPVYDSLPQIKSPSWSWWMIKMYNPEKADGLDLLMDNWKNCKTNSHSHYVKA